MNQYQHISFREKVFALVQLMTLGAIVSTITSFFVEYTLVKIERLFLRISTSIMVYALFDQTFDLSCLFLCDISLVELFSHFLKEKAITSMNVPVLMLIGMDGFSTVVSKILDPVWYP